MSLSLYPESTTITARRTKPRELVGRIVVGKPLGPGAERFDYWAGKPETGGWRHAPAAARQIFPTVAHILAERRVHPVAPRR